MAALLHANGLAGQRLEKVVGNQIIDVGTNQDSTALAGEPIQFDFNLLTSDTRDPLPNTNVAVDIWHEGKSMMNVDLISEQPITLLVYTFPEAGDYKLTVTFYDKGRMPQELATASFDLKISGSTFTTRVLYVALFASVVLGVFGGYWRTRKKGIASRP